MMLCSRRLMAQQSHTCSASRALAISCAAVTNTSPSELKHGHTHQLKVAVVGGGITGAAAAVHLAKRQPHAEITVYDLSKFTPGGRLSSRTPRTANDPQFDHGAQAIGPSNTPAFNTVLQDWIQQGLVAEWPGHAGVLDAATGKFTVNASHTSSCSQFGVPSNGPQYVGVPAMGSLVSRYLATQPNIHVKLGTRVAHVKLTQHVLGTDSTPEHSSGSSQLAWQLRGIEASRPAEESDLGQFNAVIVTDSLAAKPGSPGHIQVSSNEADNGTAAQLVQTAQQAMAKVAAMQRVPLFTLMVAFDASQLPDTKNEQGGRLFSFTRAAVTNSAYLSWISEDSTKPKRAAIMGQGQDQQQQLVTLVAISTPQYAQQLLGNDHPGAPLPPQTPDYLASRASKMWQDIKPELELAAGGVSLPDPKMINIHRWGSAYTQPAVGQPCLIGDEQSEGSSKDTASAASGRLPVFVLAGDFCLGPGIENAVLSGIAAADVVIARIC